ncbi:MAG TPA: cytochrome c1 [Steroidobacteraceae bacterium]|jgi:ubiquinol-cytochrome c reductase cytochrome c1 subunit|nr:cytochrome c1 [Steroidobacteraceae bacterium]
MAKLATLVLVPVLALAVPLMGHAAEIPGVSAIAPVDWQSWHVDNEVSDLASLQRGARNFMNYCEGCHALKYMRYQRMATDLKIPNAVLQANLVPPGSTALDYISTPMPGADALNWFGKVPPDLSDMARYKGPNYIYQYLKTFYQDPASATGSNNLADPNVAMPDVLSDLEGVKQAVFRTVKQPDGQSEQVFDHFATVSPGNMTPEQFDGFVRDTVNFLDYVGEPAQVQRRSMGIWVVLFLLALTGVAWLLKKEYWKDVH